MKKRIAEETTYRVLPHDLDDQTDPTKFSQSAGDLVAVSEVCQQTGTRGGHIAVFGVILDDLDEKLQNMELAAL